MSSHPLTPDPATSTPTVGGRTTTTAAVIAHVPLGSNDPGIVPELLTTKQASQMAGVGEHIWWAMTRSQLAPKPLFIGTGLRPMVRYRRSEILQWIADGCHRTDGRDNQR